MSYNIIAVPTFKEQLKRLAKKYPSIKKNLADLFEAQETQPILVSVLATITTKYALLSLQKVATNQAVPGLLQTNE